MANTVTGIMAKSDSFRDLQWAVVAWVLTSVYYFYQYALRSAPAVMMPELSDGFGVTPAAVAAIVALFYYGYSPFSLIAGVAMDRIGPRRLLPTAAATVGIGALLFSTGQTELASLGRFLQGAGGVFALVGAVYIATKHFPPTRAATLIGATQMFGMAGGSAGQFVVGPLIGNGVPWNTFWMGMGIAGLVIGVILHGLLPQDKAENTSGPWLPNTLIAFKTVFGNPQSILCGLIAGLLMIPTTIFDMIWGVRFLQDAHGLDYGTAVMRSAAVPFGWIIGSPLLGLISDWTGRRKPVLICAAIVLGACLAWILFGPPGVFPGYSLALVTGVASGATMLLYTIIKEANPPEYGGTATGVVNFLNFTFSALLAPVFGWILQSISGGSETLETEHFQGAFWPMLLGVGIAILMSTLLKETGTAARTCSKSGTEEK
jgi:MFS family permease